jgi:hypothetical protein
MWGLPMTCCARQAKMPRVTRSTQGCVACDPPWEIHHFPLGHIQRADPFRCPKRSESVCMGWVADTKMRADSTCPFG